MKGIEVSQGGQCKRIQIKPQGGAWGNGCIDPLLLTIDAVEADAFSVVVVQDFGGVTVEDGDDSPVASQRLVSFLYSASGTHELENLLLT